jgi:hypothetical protein
MGASHVTTPSPNHPPVEEARPARGVGVTAVVVFTGLVLLQRLDSTLGAMQLPGQPGATASGTATWRVFFNPAERMEAVAAWRAWDAVHPEGWDSGRTLAAYVLIDSVLVAVALGILLLIANQKAGGKAPRDVLSALLGRPRGERSPRAGFSVATAQSVEGSGGDGAAAPASEREAPPAEDGDPAPGHGGATSSTKILLGFVPACVLGYMAADIGENVALMATHATQSRTALYVTGALSLLKWAALLAAVAPLVLAAIPALVRRPAPPPPGGRRPTLGEEVTALRAQVASVALLAVFVFLPGDLGQQVDDALLALAERPHAWAWTIGTTGALSALLWATGRLCLITYRTAPPGGNLRPRTLILLAIAGAVCTGLGAASIAGALPLVALTAPGVLLLGFVLLSLPVRSETTPAWGRTEVPERVFWWLTAAPLLALGLVALRCGVLVLVSASDVWSYAQFLLVGGLSWLAGVVTAVRSYTSDRGERPAHPHWPTALWLAPTLSALALVAGVVGAVSPVWLGAGLGAWAVFLVFSMLVLALLTALVLLGDLLPAKGVLAVAKLRRVPLVAAFAACVLATSVIDMAWPYHDVRRIPADPALTSTSVTLEQATQQWLDEGTDRAGQRPMVLVAASGGGIRAAYWTSAVLSCLLSGSSGEAGAAEDAPVGTLTPVAEDDELAEVDPCGPATTAAEGAPQPEGDVFLASGISGSSVGLAFRRALGGNASAYTRALAEDFLGSMVAGYFFRDAPNSVLRRLPFEDRATVMERAWEEAVDRQDGDLTCGVLPSSRRAVDGECAVAVEDAADLKFPVLLLNSMGADDACRITASPLDLGLPPAAGGDAGSGIDCRSLTEAVRSPIAGTYPSEARAQLAATRDVHDHTCDPASADRQDVSLSVAAHLSARFPYVSPTGRLLSCLGDGASTYALDGGVIESSATAPLYELWPTLLLQLERWNEEVAGGQRSGPCIVPRLLLLDNGYVSFAERGDAGRPLEAAAPVGAVQAAQAYRAGSPRQALALAVEQALQENPCADADPEVPAVAHFYPVAHPGPQAPLGWTLSAFSRDDLRRELTNDHNLCQLSVFRAWFGEGTSMGMPSDLCTS